MPAPCCCDGARWPAFTARPGAAAAAPAAERALRVAPECRTHGARLGWLRWPKARHAERGGAGRLRSARRCACRRGHHAVRWRTGRAAMLARALMADPRLLVVDEPLADLDPRHAWDAARRLRDLAAQQGRLVIASIHDLNIALRCATPHLGAARRAVAGRWTAAGRARRHAAGRAVRHRRPNCAAAAHATWVDFAPWIGDLSMRALTPVASRRPAAAASSPCHHTEMRWRIEAASSPAMARQSSREPCSMNWSGMPMCSSGNLHAGFGQQFAHRRARAAGHHVFLDGDQRARLQRHAAARRRDPWVSRSACPARWHRADRPRPAPPAAAGRSSRMAQGRCGLRGASRPCPRARRVISLVRLHARTRAARIAHRRRLTAAWWRCTASAGIRSRPTASSPPGSECSAGS